MSDGGLNVLWRMVNGGINGTKHGAGQCGEMRLYVADLNKRRVYVCVRACGWVVIERRFPCPDYILVELMVNEWMDSNMQ